jgi:hypothetical protein
MSNYLSIVGVVAGSSIVIPCCFLRFVVWLFLFYWVFLQVFHCWRVVVINNETCNENRRGFWLLFFLSKNLMDEFSIRKLYVTFIVLCTIPTVLFEKHKNNKEKNNIIL